MLETGLDRLEECAKVSALPDRGDSATAESLVLDVYQRAIDPPEREAVTPSEDARQESITLMAKADWDHYCSSYLIPGHTGAFDKEEAEADMAAVLKALLEQFELRRRG